MNTVHWILWLAVGVLAIIGLAWVLARIADGIERAWGWLVRRDSADPPWWWKPWLPRRVEDEDYEDEGDPDPLPPERTWEQMTSHQLPVVQESRDGERSDAPDHRGPGWPVNGAFSDQRARLSALNERRAPWWEAEQRQAYEALGLEFPSGLMARVREAAQ